MTKSNKTWHQLSLLCQADFAEQIADTLQGLDALSVTLADAKDQPLFQLQPNEQPLWQHTVITALYTQKHEAEQARDLTQSLFDQPLAFDIEEIEEQDWVRLTQQNFPAKSFGQTKSPLWVIPSWEANNYSAEPKIIIDPGLAFGTGTHPTTHLCLQWLADHPPTDFNVIDYGCGSGILALAALALRAKHVAGIDHDEQAIEASHNNLALNPNIDASRFSISLPSDANANPPVDLVIANILANPLIELSNTISDLTVAGGTLLISGLLITEVESVIEHYPNFDAIEQLTLDEWACVALRKKN